MQYDQIHHMKDMLRPGKYICVQLDYVDNWSATYLREISSAYYNIKFITNYIKFITNYIKGRKAYTPYRNHTSSQRQFKTGVPQGCVLSPTLSNIYTADIPPPVQVMAYADDITITSTHTSYECSQEIHTTIPT